MRCLNWILRVTFHCMILICCTQSEISNIVTPVKNDFSCLNKTAGFYADTRAGCKIYYTCDEYGNKFTYHCPEETAFRQDALICDHAHLVRCHGYTIHDSKDIKEEKNINSSYTRDSRDKNQFVFHVTTSPKINDKVRYGFTIGTKELSRSFNRTEDPKQTITNVRIGNYVNSTTSFPTHRSAKIGLQHVSFQNSTQEGVLDKNWNFTAQKQMYNTWDKFNDKDRINQKTYLNSKTNDALYNFMKIPPNIVPGNGQNQQNSAKNYQASKNAANFLTIPSTNHRNYPYLETLKSIQKNTQTSTMANSIRTDHASVITTELPVYALTLSLKPLVPNELEHDPYYPKFTTSTESYYTPIANKEWLSTKDPTQTTWSNTHFELPPTLPDLNSLEDIVDRRKLFYIPRIKSN